MVGDDEEQRLVWKLKVSLRVGGLNLKLNLLQNRLSSWKLHRLSFLFRFRKHRLKIDSQSKPYCVRFLRRLVLFRKRREVESQVHSKKLIELMGTTAKKAIGVGVVTLVIIFSFLLRSMD
ncbi:hypothetical protein V5N11_028201 [Cardamine amara subsp. amara]|uniref:Transmembrane protein n=1 Tax=Cardamine amara subsp. amara TaxID=228776 RepID=A0ABD1B2W6_CARAN